MELLLDHTIGLDSEPISASNGSVGTIGFKDRNLLRKVYEK